MYASPPECQLGMPQPGLWIWKRLSGLGFGVMDPFQLQDMEDLAIGPSAENACHQNTARIGFLLLEALGAGP